MKTLCSLFLSIPLLAMAQDATPPPPRSVGYLAPAIPLSVPETNAPPSMVVESRQEWELTFEWTPELGSTNATVYPIRIQVPFEKDSGFVRIRARKVEVKK